MNPDNLQPINMAYAGVVQSYELLTEFATRESTLLMIALWMAINVKLTHYLGATGDRRTLCPRIFVLVKVTRNKFGPSS